jgi:hypothetical protein
LEDYGVDPPRAHLGAIRTNNLITMEFDLIIEREGSAEELID